VDVVLARTRTRLASIGRLTTALLISALLISAESTAVAAPARATTIQGGACNAFAHAHPLGSAYTDSQITVPTCGPRANFDADSQGHTAVHPYPGSFTTPGYQCVEFSERYLYYKYGVTMPQSTNGDQVVDHYATHYPATFTAVSNGTANQSPVMGDVLSFSPIATFNASSGGHTSVVQSSTVNSSGNGQITTIEENASISGVAVLNVVAWSVQYPGFPYIKWLHAGTVATPGNGNFVKITGTTTVYRLAGGAPMWVTGWAGFGGTQPVTSISAAEFAAFRSYPADGTYLVTTTGEIFVSVGGAAFAVPSWAAVGGTKASTTVDQWDLANRGNARAHLLTQPMPGTVVLGIPSMSGWLFNGTCRVPATVALGTVAVADAGVASYQQCPPEQSALAVSSVPRINIGQRVLLSASLSDPVSGARIANSPVTVQSQPAGRTTWTAVAAASTSASGAASVTVAPTVNTNYRWTYAGVGIHLPTVSSVQAVYVAQTVTRGASSVHLRRGQLVGVWGTVSPTAPGRRVVLQQLVNGRWQTLNFSSTIARRTMPNHHVEVGYQITFTRLLKRNFAYRIYVAACATNTAGASSPVRISFS
jgi:hypothetical protein